MEVGRASDRRVFPREFPANKGKWTEAEFKSLARTFGFDPVYFRFDTLTDRGRGVAARDKAVTNSDLAELVAAGTPGRAAMHRTVNQRDGLSNAKAMLQGAELISSRAFTFAECHHAITAFEMSVLPGLAVDFTVFVLRYEAGGEGVPIEDGFVRVQRGTVEPAQLPLMKAIKMAGRQAAWQLVQATVLQVTSRKKCPTRIQLYDFLPVIAKLDLADPEVDLVEADIAMDFSGVEVLHSLCDFERLLRTPDVRQSRRLSDIWVKETQAAAEEAQQRAKTRWHNTLKRMSSVPVMTRRKSASELRSPKTDANPKKETARTSSFKAKVPAPRRPSTAPPVRQFTKNDRLDHPVPGNVPAHVRPSAKLANELDTAYHTHYSAFRNRVNASDGLVTPTGPPADQLENALQVQGFKSSAIRLVTDDAILECRGHLEDLRLAMDTHSYRPEALHFGARPEIRAPAAKTDWGVLLQHRSADGDGENVSRLNSLYHGDSAEIRAAMSSVSAGTRSWIHSDDSDLDFDRGSDIEDAASLNQTDAGQQMHAEMTAARQRIKPKRRKSVGGQGRKVVQQTSAADAKHKAALQRFDELFPALTINEELEKIRASSSRPDTVDEGTLLRRDWRTKGRWVQASKANAGL